MFQSLLNNRHALHTRADEKTMRVQEKEMEQTLGSGSGWGAMGENLEPESGWAAARLH